MSITKETDGEGKEKKKKASLFKTKAIQIEGKITYKEKQEKKEGSKKKTLIHKFPNNQYKIEKKKKIPNDQQSKQSAKRNRLLQTRDKVEDNYMDCHQ